MAWTADRTEELKALWRTDRSAGEIARLMGGTTRNAVIGKARRMGLPAQRRASPAPVAAYAKAKVRPVGPRLVFFSPPPMARVALPPVREEAPPLVARLEALSAHHCRWPIGDPAEAGFGFCGVSRASEGPYCPAHRARAYPPFRPGQAANGEELVRALRRFLERAA